MEKNTNQTRIKEHLLDGIEAVIFDLDGTLVDSMWMWEAIDIEYLGKHGYSLPEHLQQTIEGMSFHETAVYFKEHFQIADSLDKIKSDWNAMAYEHYRSRVFLKSGVADFLKELTARGIKLGIATSNSRELVDTVLSSLQITDLFSSIHTSGEVPRGKPAPDIYLCVAKHLSVTPDKCLVFEDCLPGLQAGKNAGMRVCCIYDRYSREPIERLKEISEFYLESFKQLYA